MRRSFIALALVTVLASMISCGSCRAFGQSTSGDIFGTITDHSGAFLAGAVVSVKNMDTGVSAATQANSVGEFHFSNLPAGTYTITGSAPAFASYSLNGFEVKLNKTTTAALVLPVAAASADVAVSADAPVILDTSTAQLQSSFESEELRNMPTATVGLGVLNLALLIPGVASAGGLGDGVGPSVGGMRSRSNNFTIEGIDNNNLTSTGPLVYLPSSAVGEFTVITNQFSPEFGHSMGGQFNSIIVSGANRIHGSAYEYFDNRNLNAENAIQGGKIPNPRYDYNRYGGQVGGPVKKDKLFYFANFERQTTGESGQSFLCTPTAAGFAALAGIHNFSANNLAVYSKYVPASSQQIDYNSDRACGNNAPKGKDLIGNPTVGSDPLQYTYIFDDAAYNSSARIFGTLNPTQIPLGNDLVISPNYNNFEALTTAADWTIDTRDSFRARYIYNRYTGIDTVASLPDFFQPLPQRYHLIALSEYHTFTRNLNNEVRIGFNRFYNLTSAGEFPFAGLDSFPNLTLFDLGAINIGPDKNAPAEAIQNTYQFTDNLSWVKGKHNFKFGFDGRKYIAPQSFTQRVRGDYEWHATSEYLHDLAPTNFGERSTGNFIFSGDQIAVFGYANDIWHISGKLSLNYGLRYEFTSVPAGERKQVLNEAASVPGVVVFSTPQPQYTNLMPRLGINYALDQNTSIRAGFGMSVDVLYDNLGTLSNPPQFSSTYDVGVSPSPSAGALNFLSNGGLPHGTGTLATFCEPGTGSGTTPCVVNVAAQQAATSAYIPNQTLPYAETWSVGVQHVFHRDYTAELRYLGTRGIHLPTQTQMNITPCVTAANQLPTFMSTPGAAQLAGLTSTLAKIEALSIYLPQFVSSSANFTGKILAYRPFSESNYNGLAASLNRRFIHGLLLDIAYTYSKTMDDATDTVNNTSLTPRRPQNSQDIAADYSRSALDRTHRLTLAASWNEPFFRQSGWIEKNLFGNWVVTPSYSYESPEYFTVLSGVNSNLNGDSTGIDRTIFNKSGVAGTGSGVTALYDASRAGLCAAGVSQCTANLVAYQANNANARYIEAGPGTLPTASRNTEPTAPINNLDAMAGKIISMTERYSVQFQAQAFNLLNHAQYIPGTLDNVNSNNQQVLNYQTVTNSLFDHPGKFFTAHARTIQLTLKLDF
jgi:hypothetical protein